MAASTHSIPQPRTRPVANVLPANGPVNVGDVERWLSLLGGGLLALYTAATLPGDRRAPVWGRRPPVSRSEGAVPPVSDHGAQHRRARSRPASPRSVAGSDEQPQIVLASS